MKIALLHYAASPVVGGVEKVIFEHSRLMADASHEVQVIAGRGAQTDPRVKFVHLPLVDSQAPEVLHVKRELDAGTVSPQFEGLTRQLARKLTEILEGTDWLFAHNVCSLNKNLPLTAALRLVASGRGPRRIALWHHDLAWTTPRYAAELHQGYPWDLLRTDWPVATQVTVSRYRARELAKLWSVGEDRIRVIPNGVDIEAVLKLGSEAMSIVDQHGLFEADALIILPVRITPRKNIEMALEVLAHLKADYPRAKLLITGPLGSHNAANAAYLEQLQQRRTGLGVRDSAIFLTAGSDRVLSDEVIHDLFRLADALLLPSKEEGFGIPVLEAGVAGIPVFCSNIETLQEVGREDVVYFGPDEDASVVAAKMSQELRSRRSHALRKRVLRDYAWAQVYEKHLAPLLKRLDP